MPAPVLHGLIGVRRAVEVVASCTGRGCNRRLLTKAGGSHTFAAGVHARSFEVGAQGVTLHIPCPSCGHRNIISVNSPVSP